MFREGIACVCLDMGFGCDEGVVDGFIWFVMFVVMVLGLGRNFFFFFILVGWVEGGL